MPDSLNSSTEYYSVGFYNLENLFDTVDDPHTLDDDFTQHSAKKWNQKRFRKKVKKLARVITNIGYQDIKHPPVLLGVAEVENAAVLDSLIESKFLRNKGYDYVHFDSPDERGIDTALLYRSEYFSVLKNEIFELQLVNELGDRDYTRDILYVYGELQDQPIHILVNHWPSRRKGTEETAHKREAAAHRNLEVIEQILQEDPEGKIIVMGDFNDDPHSNSVKSMAKDRFYNPMELLLTNTEGTLSHKNNWHLFDQILITHNFLQGPPNRIRFEAAKIFSPENIKEYKGKFKGMPFRTFVGKRYLGGFSDHFPVYVIFSMK